MKVVENINWEMNQIIDKALEEYSGVVEIVKKNREKFNKTITDLGFKKQWSSAPWSVAKVIDDPEDNLKKTVTIHTFDPKTAKVKFTVRTETKPGESDKSEEHTTQIEELSDYVVSDELFETKYIY